MMNGQANRMVEPQEECSILILKRIKYQRLHKTIRPGHLQPLTRVSVVSHSVILNKTYFY